MEKKVILTISQEGDFYFERSEFLKIVYPPSSVRFSLIKKKSSFISEQIGEVAYGKVVDAMSAAKIAGVEKMSMLTVPPRR